jgi:hypothetical protein
MSVESTDLWTKIKQRWARWLVQNIAACLIVPLGALFILEGSQPSSPMTRGAINADARWWLLVVWAIVGVVIPAFAWVFILEYKKAKPGEGPGQSDSRGRVIGLARTTAGFSVTVIGLDWFFSQQAFINEHSKLGVFPEHAVQFVGGLVLVYALLQWTYKMFVRKIVLRKDVSLASAVGISAGPSGERRIIFADDTSKPMDLGGISIRPFGKKGVERISIVISNEKYEYDLYVSESGNFWLQAKSGQENEEVDPETLASQLTSSAYRHPR